MNSEQDPGFLPFANPNQRSPKTTVGEYLAKEYHLTEQEVQALVERLNAAETKEKRGLRRNDR